MAQVNQALESNLALVVGLLGLVSFVLLVLTFFQERRVRRLKRRLDAITRGAEGSLEGVLETHLDTVFRVSHDVDQLAGRTATLERNAQVHFQRLGLVRFNPFEDTGGNQSFALALLNGDDNGFVVSSLHSRTGTRVYAKSISAGSSDAALSTEEAEAVELAKRGSAATSPAANGKPTRVIARPALEGRSELRTAAPVERPAVPAVPQPSLPTDAELDARALERRLRFGEEDGSQPLWEDTSGS